MQFSDRPCSEDSELIVKAKPVKPKEPTLETYGSCYYALEQMRDSETDSVKKRFYLNKRELTAKKAWEAGIMRRDLRAYYIKKDDNPVFQLFDDSPQTKTRYTIMLLRSCESIGVLEFK